VLIDPSTFGGPQGSDYLADRIRALSVPARVIKNGANLENALSEARSEKIPVK
jgi:hypothetical protein